MITELLDILEADAPLMRIIRSIRPLESDDTGNCMIYDYTLISDDAVKAAYRVKLTTICGTLAQAEAASARVRKLLLTFGDAPLTSNILRVEANGGGHLRDDARRKYHTIIYLNVTTRSDIYG